MAVTTNRGYPIAGVSGAPDGPYEFQRLAEAVDVDVQAQVVRVDALEQVVIARADRTPTGSDVSFSGADVNLVSTTIVNARAGIYRVEGLAALKASSGSTNGSVFVKATTGGVTRSAYFRKDLPTFWNSGEAYIGDYVHSGGNLTISFGYDCPVGTAVLANPGTKQPCYVQTQYVGKASVTA